jgi:hypothetical protein
MFGINYIAILVMAVAAFVASSVYYVVFGNALAALLPAESVATDIRKVPAWKKAAEFVRGFVVSFVVASLVEQFGVVDWKGALRLAVLVWIGFPFMILTGSVLWDNRPWKFAAIHSGDWLMKLVPGSSPRPSLATRNIKIAQSRVLMTVISGTWHR